MSKLKLSLRERILMVVILLAFLAAFQKVWYSKKSKEIAVINSQVQTLETKITANQLVVDTLKKRQVSSSKDSDSNSKMNSYIQSNKNLSKLVQKLGVDSSEAPINVRRLAVNNYSEVNNFNRSQFKLDIESSFLALGQFLERLEQSQLLIEVKSVKVTRISNDLKRCNAEIELHGYTVKGERL